MTETGEIADFVLDVEYDGLSDDVIDELKKRLADSIGIGIGAIEKDAVQVVHQTVSDISNSGDCTIWCSEKNTSPPQAAMANTTLTRYLDFMDSFLAPGETPHPSDNIGSIIACGEYTEATGKELIEAIGVAYEIQGELAWNAPVRDRGWDHVTHTVISAAAGAGKILNLDRNELRNSIGIAGTAHNALRVTRTGGINEWKGIASANAARNAVYSCMLAKNGMEGPKNLFEGQKGWKQIISDDFEVNYSENCEHVFDTMTKKYVAETYAQSAVEGVIELVEKENIEYRNIENIHLDTFHGAKLIIGGGEGSRYEVKTRAQADHSLPYMLAVAAIDKEVLEHQYEKKRIQKNDVQELLRKVEVEEDEKLTKRFENGEMPAIIDIKTEQETYTIEKDDFEGHPRTPMTWDAIEKKFKDMAKQRYNKNKQEKILDTIKNMENYTVNDLTSKLD